jgi:glycosyltransferase involved in cell wall biosynthesis
MALPKISIVLPTYNGARYIGECIDSCLTQTFKDFELIVVIDGSTDNTEELVRTYSDDRVYIIKTENRGQALAMNTGFDSAKGMYWSWTSDDNIYLPEAFEVMAKYLDDHPDAQSVSTDCLMIDDAGKVFSYQECVWQCFLYRAEAGKLAGPHSPEARIIEDVDFFERISHFAGPVHRISMPFLKYRVHKGSVSYRMATIRQLISLKRNYDLVMSGIIKQDLEDLFLEKLSNASLYRDKDTMDKIVEFAADRELPFLESLQKRKQFLITPVGWFFNRASIASRSLKIKIQNKIKLWKYLKKSETQRGIS